MDPTKNTNNQGANAGDDRQALFTPQDEQVTGGVPAQPAVDLSHPYLSNHPTQTFNTDTGDIILNPVGAKPKQNKRPFIIGGVILVIIGVLILVISSMLAGSNQKVLSLLKENYDAANRVEDFFINAYSNQLAVNEVFTPEIHNQLNNDMATLEMLQKALAKTNPTSLSSSTQQHFILLQNQLNERIPNYQSSVLLYNSLYEAYANNTPSTLTDLFASENYYVSLTAERFYSYLITQDELWPEIKDNNCDSNNNSSDFCQQLLETYFDNQANFDSNTLIVTAIFTAYYDGPYAQDDRLMPRIDILLEELK